MKDEKKFEKAKENVKEFALKIKNNVKPKSKVYKELNQKLEDIRKKAFSEPLKEDTLEKFYNEVINRKLAMTNFEYNKLLEGYTKLTEYKDKTIPKRKAKNIVITAAGVVVVTAAIIGGTKLVGCAKNKPENREYTIERPTDEEPTKNDFNNNPTEPETEKETEEDKEVPEGYNFRADDLDSLKEQATKLAQQLIDNGYVEVNTDADKLEFARKVLDFIFVKNIESILNYKNLVDLDQDLSLNFANMYANYIEIEQAIAMSNVMTQAPEEIIDASVFEQKTADSQLLNKLNHLILEYNNSKTEEEQQAAFNKLFEFKNEFIGNMTTNDLNYSATTIHMILKTILHLDESTKVDGHILITDSENLLAIFNSIEVKCPNLVIDDDNEEYKNAIIGANQAGQGGYSNAENTKFENSLKYALDNLKSYCIAVNAMLDVKGEVFEEEYSYENIIKNIAYHMDNINKTVKSFDEFINAKKQSKWAEQDKKDQEAGNVITPEDETRKDNNGDIICVLPIEPTETSIEGPTTFKGNLIDSLEVEGVFIEANLTQERYNELINFYNKNKDTLLSLGYNGSEYDSYKTSDVSKNMILKACYDKGVALKQQDDKNNVQATSSVVGNKENGGYIPVEKPQPVGTSYGETENVTMASKESQTVPIEQTKTQPETTVNVISESEFDDFYNNDNFWFEGEGIAVDLGTSYGEIEDETIPMGKTR